MLFHCLQLVLFLALSGECEQNTLTVKNCGRSILPKSDPDRIVGGNDAKPGEFPFMVSLRELDDFGFEHSCGAVILNENWVVTAAHCIEYPPNPQRYDILVGLYKLSQEREPRVRQYKISKIVIHEDFDDDTNNNDIALIKTLTPIDISGSNGYINGICLPKSKEDPSGYATVIGWGHTRLNGRNSDTLRKVVIPIIERKICNEAYQLSDYGTYDILDTMICAGTQGKDSCQNDSGGPLFQTDKNGVFTIVGLVSHGAGCGNILFPGIYTKIAMYQDWMYGIMS